ncbi:hypothetical protein M5362_28765 [Streptomyces sp. Je 1-79]|uniref:hypothetical protein n=1 Tax=Streptomyces sp. Je 1-79 TaxID=2943847 RepID=UPI0021A6BEF4|nr:hypothetical protein [Streptomyces sp. Je 1-79]MCT4357113.1 hypothetical protein [Streptomyces sp. Je 1-79]
MIDTKTSARTFVPSSGTAVVPAPRWAELAAKAALWSTVPSGLWRIPFAFGATMGFTGEALAFLHRDVPGWGSVYMVTLSVLAEVLAFLTLGLVRPWGRVVPRWVPVIGGRTVRPLAVIIPATLGALVLTVGGILGVLGWNSPDNMGSPESPQGLAGVVMTLCYLPLVAWGPLLMIVTADYARRTLRRR